MKNTKLTALLFFIASLFLFNSCDSEKIEDFDLSFLNQPVTAPPFATSDGNGYLLTDTLSSDLLAQLQALGASATDIESIKLSDLKLRVTGPAGRNFDSIDFAEVRVITGTGANDFTKIAFTEAISDGLTEVPFKSQDVNLKDLLASGESFRLGFWAYDIRSFSTSTDFSFDLVFKVKVKVTE